MYTHIEDNIYYIHVTLPDSPLKNLNAYLIKGKNRNLLIDTGFRRPECRESLEEGLSELEVSMDDTDIFLTHLHSDHTGLASEIASDTTKVFIGAEDGQRLMHVRGNSMSEAAIQEQQQDGFSAAELTLLPQSPSWRYASRGREDYILLNDGNVLEYGGRKLRLVCTPGHTPGHMCLWDSENKVMFLGDHVLFDITPNITTWPDFEDPLGKYVTSLVAISGYPVRIALPGHRGIGGSLSERVGSIIKHHGRRLKEMLDVLDIYPGLSAYDLAGKMSWNIRTEHGWADFPTEQRWFAVKETKAHLEYLKQRGRVKMELWDGIMLYYPG